ncbi:hypothetical protein HDV04_001382 [Boothiomyces sp. JEL0838]|nr:hypothetical protein HDV04_001382 [Boothiomyces sp. JEL0838]
MSGDLNIHESMTYLQTSPTIAGSINWVSFKPIGPTSYGSNSSATIKVTSNTELLNLQRSYLKFQLTVTLPSGVTLPVLSPFGASAAFKSIQEQWGGLALNTFDNWNIVNSIRNLTSTKERQDIANICEGFAAYNTVTTYGTPTPQVGPTLTAGAADTYCIPIPTGVDTDQLIPIAALNSGIQYIYNFAPDAEVFSGTGGQPTYTISNLEFVACLVTPPASYLSQLSEGLNKGADLKVTCSMYKVFNASLTAGMTPQNILVNTGFYDSVNTLTVVTKNTSTPNVMKSNVIDFYVSVDSKRYPRNKLIGGVSGDPELIYQQLASTNTVYSSMSISASNYQFQHLSFKSSQDPFTGIPTKNGAFECVFDYNAGSLPAAGDVSTFIFNFDAVLHVSQNGVALQLDNF